MEVRITMDTSTVKGKVSAIRNIVSMGAIPMDKRLDYVREILLEPVGVVSPPMVARKLTAQDEAASLPRITVKATGKGERKPKTKICKNTNLGIADLPQYQNLRGSKEYRFVMESVETKTSLGSEKILSAILGADKKALDTWKGMFLSMLSSHEGLNSHYHAEISPRFSISSTDVLAALFLGVRRGKILFRFILANPIAKCPRICFHTVEFTKAHPEYEWFTDIPDNLKVGSIFSGQSIRYHYGAHTYFEDTDDL